MCVCVCVCVCVCNSEISDLSSKCILIWIKYNNDVINDFDCVRNHDVYPQKIHLCSKDIYGVSFCALKLSIVYIENTLPYIKNI